MFSRFFVNRVYINALYIGIYVFVGNWYFINGPKLHLKIYIDRFAYIYIYRLVYVFLFRFIYFQIYTKSVYYVFSYVRRIVDTVIELLQNN